MAVTKRFVAELFNHLAHGEADAFFAHVSPEVDWTVMGTHPLAGRYAGREAFRRGTFARLGPCLRGPIRLTTQNILTDGDAAAVELAIDATAANGRPFDNRYCWMVRFAEGLIVEVRAYLDSALVARLIEENEPR